VQPFFERDVGKNARMIEANDEDAALKTDHDAFMAAEFSKLVDAAGGSTAAARILKKARGTVEQWAAGRRRLPMAPAVMLAMHVDKNLDRFAIGGEEAIAIRHMVPAPLGTSASVPDGFVAVPMLQVQAGAGRGRFATPDDLSGREMVAFREVWLRSLGFTPGRTHILWAVGDSMVPTIKDGDMLLVDRMIDQVLDDGIYVVVVGGGVMVKRIQLRHNGSVVLKSDNQRYDEQTIPADEVPSLVVEGRVRWVGGPI